MNWLGLLDKKTGIDSTASTTLDAFCSLLEDKLVYAPGERDMVAMHHEFGIEWSNGSREHKTSTLIAYGDPNSYSAMAKTVGLPAAIATKLILQGKIKQAGVIAPMEASIYRPIMAQLEAEGIKFVEFSSKTPK